MIDTIKKMGTYYTPSSVSDMAAQALRSCEHIATAELEYHHLDLTYVLRVETKGGVVLLISMNDTGKLISSILGSKCIIGTLFKMCSTYVVPSVGCVRHYLMCGGPKHGDMICVDSTLPKVAIASIPDVGCSPTLGGMPVEPVVATTSLYTFKKLAYKTQSKSVDVQTHVFRVLVHESIPNDAVESFVVNTLFEDLSCGAYPEYAHLVFDIARY